MAGVFLENHGPVNKIKTRNVNGPTNNTIPKIKHYFDCNNIDEADRCITSEKPNYFILGNKLWITHQRHSRKW